jgi:hypothetical protein
VKVALVRKVMRGLVRPGLRRVHFSKQQDGDRWLVVNHLVLEDKQAFFTTWWRCGHQVDQAVLNSWVGIGFPRPEALGW